MEKKTGKTSNKDSVAKRWTTATRKSTSKGNQVKNEATTTTTLDDFLLTITNKHFHIISKSKMRFT